MNPGLSEIMQGFAIYTLPVLFAVVFHEVAHGWVAEKCGDKSARMLGRLSMNPLKHIDPVGTILVPALTLFLGGILFGWAKPVPIDERNLRNRRRDMVLVAAAGPFANLLMAILWGLLAKLMMTLPVDSYISKPLILMGQAGIAINLWLMLLNLLPIPPLDGSRVVSQLLPRKMAYHYDHLQQYGFFILIALLYLGVLGRVLQPMFDITGSLIVAMLHLP